MRYFTRELWLSLQTSNRQQSVQNSQRADAEYRAQLASLAMRVDKDAFAFFAEADIHDGELMELAVKDGSRPAPISEASRPWKQLRQLPVGVMLSVLDANSQFLWSISYSSMRRVLVDFPSADPLFYREGQGFGDWGYHELTDAGDGFLRHEILFATGAVLLFEFKHVHVSRSNFRPRTTSR